MALTTSGLTNNVVIRETYAPGFEEGLYRNNGLLPVLPAPIDSGGDTSYRWKFNTTGNNSVEIYTEGQAQLPAGNQVYADCAVDYLAFRFMTQVTGHARAALRSNWIPAIEEEQTLGLRDLIDLITTTYMASTYGIEAGVAATGSYAGQTRGSITWFESLVTAVNASLALSDIEDMLEAMKDNERGRVPSMLFGPVNQETNIYRLGLTAGMRVGDYSNPLPSFQNQTIGGMRGVFLGDWTNTVLVACRPEHLVVVQHQPYQVKDMSPSGDSDVFQNSYMGVIVVKQPKLCAKLTGVTA